MPIAQADSRSARGRSIKVLGRQVNPLKLGLCSAFATALCLLALFSSQVSTLLYFFASVLSKPFHLSHTIMAWPGAAARSEAAVGVMDTCPKVLLLLLVTVLAKNVAMNLICTVMAFSYAFDTGTHT